MIHDNFKKYIRYCLWPQPNAKSKDLTDKDGYTGTNSDTLWSALYSNIYNIFNMSAARYSGMSVDNFLKGYESSVLTPWFGAVIGNSANNEPDYTLGDIITSCKMAAIYNVNANSEIIFTTVLTNNTDNDISFDEIGLFLVVRGYSTEVWNGNTGSDASLDALFIKEVLSTPQTLPANSSINISFNLFGDTPAATVTPA